MLLQGLDADALSQLMQSVNLHTQTSAEPSHRGISAHPAAPQEGTPAQHSPDGATPSEAGPSLGMAGQDLLADCPLPFGRRAWGWYANPGKGKETC